MKMQILAQLKTISLKWLAKIFTDIHSAIVGIVLLAAISSIGVIAYFFQQIWLALIKAMQLPTPLWMTIALCILLAVYIHLRIKRKYQSAIHDTSQEFVTKYFPVGNLVWEVEIYKNDFKVIDSPICKEHDLRMIRYDQHLICPYNGKCNLEVDIDIFNSWYLSARSYIDKEIRN